MISGLYKVAFSTPLGSGHGVVSLQDGKVHGGDSTMFYVGTYSLKGAAFTAELVVDKHSSQPGMFSVLGANKASLNLSGTVSGDMLSLTGVSPQAGNVQFKATMQKVAD